jgi:chromosome partitioning protein
VEDLISLQDAAKLFGIKADRLRRAAWDGRLVSRMVGNQRLVLPSEVERFLPRARSTPPAT